MTRLPNNAICPICGVIKPGKFLVCLVCWREVPFAMRAELWTHEGRARAARDGIKHYDEAGENRAIKAAEITILSHLKQFSSALI